MFFNNASLSKLVPTAKPTNNGKLLSKSKAHELLSTLYYQMKRTKRRAQPLCRIHIKLANKSYYNKIQLKL